MSQRETITGFQGDPNSDKGDWGFSLIKRDGYLENAYSGDPVLEDEVYVSFPSPVSIPNFRPSLVPVGGFWRRSPGQRDVFERAWDRMERDREVGLCRQPSEKYIYFLFATEAIFSQFRQTLLQSLEDFLYQSKEMAYHRGRGQIDKVSIFVGRTHPKIKTLRSYLQQVQSMNIFKEKIDQSTPSNTAGSVDRVIDEQEDESELVVEVER